MHFKVSDKNIDQGMVKSATSCAVALSIRDEMKTCKGFLGVEVDATCISIEYTDRVDHFLVPKDVCEFVLKFDKEQTVNPMEFDLDEPDSTDYTQDEIYD